MKQAQAIIFSRKKNASTHSPLFYNNSEIKLSSNQKHLAVTLDTTLSFNEHINNKIHQANKRGWSPSKTANNSTT